MTDSCPDGRCNGEQSARQAELEQRDGLEAELERNVAAAISDGTYAQGCPDGAASRFQDFEGVVICASDE